MIRYLWLPVVNGEADKVKTKTSQVVITNGSNWSLLLPNYKESLISLANDLSFTVSNVEPVAINGNENTLPALTDLEWTGDDKYPSDYIKQLKAWADEAPDMYVLQFTGASPRRAVKPGTELRILCVGDSITVGFLSEDGNGYRLKLRDDSSSKNCPLSLCVPQSINQPL